jgi:hypothetical protein
MMDNKRGLPPLGAEESWLRDELALLARLHGQLIATFAGCAQALTETAQGKPYQADLDAVRQALLTQLGNDLLRLQKTFCDRLWARVHPRRIRPEQIDRHGHLNSRVRTKRSWCVCLLLTRWRQR